jgi:EmrB/QacA subfamily drug resistance transporter
MEGSDSRAAARSHAAMWVTLAAMTLSNSMILVDQTAVPLATPDAIRDLGGSLSQSQWLLTANILPLAAFMVLGGRLGDMLGLRRVFLVGGFVFMVSTGLAGSAQDLPWMIAARAAQGCGAALMMPTAVAIVSSVFPKDRRGTALGVLAGGSAFFAALGPVIGGLLTSIDWRTVFWINVPLAAITIGLTSLYTPSLRPQDRDDRSGLDLPGVTTFAIGTGSLIYGLSVIQASGLDAPGAWVPTVIGLAVLAIFVLIELRASTPMLDFRLFRHLNFLASNISQVLAGSIELGLGFLLPFFLLLVVGVSPAVAGIALIPATVPIILAGPLAGRAFDRMGGRVPLVVGFLALAASGFVLAVTASKESAVWLIPGLLLQGIGLGVVLTVNDPTGLNSVPEGDQGQAAGMINTSEQLGGAIGIAVLAAIEVSYYKHQLFARLHDHGIFPTQQEINDFTDFTQRAEQQGLGHVAQQFGEAKSHAAQVAIHESIVAHVDAFQLMFVVSGAIALLGATACLLLVRKTDRVTAGPIFTRRSRWVSANVGRTPGITRHPPPSAPDAG